jgi:hypothetical protein
VLFHTDAENYYLHYGNIYIGKDSDGKNRWTDKDRLS